MKRLLLLAAILPALAWLGWPTACDAQDARWTKPDWTFTVNDYFKRLERYDHRRERIYYAEHRNEWLGEQREEWREDRWRWNYDPRYERNAVERAEREWRRIGNSGDASFKRFRQCHERIIEVLSDQHKSEERAMNDAWTKWMGNVAFERGNLYQDPQNSIQRWSLCAPTDINDTITGSISRFGGKVYAVGRKLAGKDDVRDDGRNMRCRLWARACPELPEAAETVEDRRDRERESSRRK